MDKMWTLQVQILFIFLSFCHGDYVPGTPGDPWTEEEIVKVKEKIIWVLDNPYRALQQTYRAQEISPNIREAIAAIYNQHRYKRISMDGIMPTAAKMVRLTFHDCLVEKYTGKGCNGCFNFEGVGNLYHEDYCAKEESYRCLKSEGGTRPYEVSHTDNNNLLPTAMMLELIYNSTQYYSHNGATLFQSGKSRADLWAFAGLVAVERTIENNNKKCDHTKPPPCLLQVNELSPSCSLVPQLPNFRTGRADCISDCDRWSPQFCTTQREIHPVAHMNGHHSADFFRRNFRLNVQEAVALLGAHSIGRTHSTISLFADVPWTPQGQEDWNNFYYVNVVNRTGYKFVDPTPILDEGTDIFKCNLSVSAFMGDEDGYPISLKFRVHAENRTQSGGPFNWQLFGEGSCNPLACDRILAANKTLSINSCCHWIGYCTANPTKCPFERKPLASSYNLFMNVNMLTVDMGFAFYFKTHRKHANRPYTCKGLDRNFMTGKSEYSDIVDCPLNTYPSGLGKDPAGNERTYFAEFDFYAKNPQKWVATFTKTYDKMLENRVDTYHLVSAPTNWFNNNNK